jgi:hypothetical protein
MNQVKNYKFTLVKNNDNNKVYNIKNDDFFHFNVNEKINSENNKVDFFIEPYKNNVLFIEKFKKKVHKVIKRNNNKNLSGGKKKHKKHRRDDDDDSSDSSDDDYYVKKNNNYYDIDPIYSWWYNPLLYYSDRMYIPAFSYPLDFSYVLDLSPYYSIVETSNVTPSINVEVSAD